MFRRNALPPTSGPKLKQNVPPNVGVYPPALHDTRRNVNTHHREKHKSELHALCKYRDRNSLTLYRNKNENIPIMYMKLGTVRVTLCVGS
jgi:hypothetical protein